MKTYYNNLKGGPESSKMYTKCLLLYYEENFENIFIRLKMIEFVNTAYVTLR